VDGQPAVAGTDVSDGAGQFAGVDAGASRTRAVVTDRALRPLGRADGPAGAVRPGMVDAAADAIMGTIEEARRAAGGASLSACVVGAAGAADPAAREALARALRGRGAPARTAVRTDAEVALAAAIPAGPGILLVSGTGSIALARDGAGDLHRVGGRGWRVGDEGSGYALGRAGVSAAMQALEGRGPPTLLSQSVLARLGLGGLTALAGWSAAADPRAVADVGAVVQGAAAAGDAVALGLLDTAADDLVSHVVALRPHLAGETAVPVALAGGGLVRGRLLRRRVVTLLGARAPWATVLDADVDAAMGAARLAARGDA